MNICVRKTNFNRTTYETEVENAMEMVQEIGLYGAEGAETIKIFDAEGTVLSGAMYDAEAGCYIDICVK